VRYFSLFTGVGGFELGIESAMPKVECVGFSEIDKHASAVLRYRFPNVKNYGDITQIQWDTVPDFDLLVGGSPCQDLSVAGKRKGIDGSRSGLVWSYVEALNRKKPAYFIWENVKGALSSNNGWDFATILTAFSEAGYSLWWQVLNARDFGVPQNRERVFIVGTRDGSPREVFFERGNTEESNKIAELTSQVSDSQRIFSTGGVSPALRSGGGGMGAKTGLYLIARTIRVGGAGSPHGYKSNWDSYEIDGKIRRLTPRECERLMSWPDDWTKYGIMEDKVVEMSDTQRYKMCGNGVVSKVVEAVVNTHFND
jgi:DNA (cytosine-5)-methyltransferase 1